MLIKRIERVWRQSVTVFSFLMGGVFVCLIGFFVSPILFILVRNKNSRKRLVRSLLSKLCRLLFWWLRATGTMKLRVLDSRELLSADSFAEGALLLANHPTYIDFMALLTVFPQAACVVKQDLRGLLPLRIIVSSADYIYNVKDRELIDSCVERLLNGESVIMFPEGTRTESEGINKFHRGAATIALESEAKVFPIMIRCVPATLRKGQSWLDVPVRRFDLSLHVNQHLSIELTPEQRAPENAPVVRRMLTEDLENYFRFQVTNGIS